MEASTSYSLHDEFHELTGAVLDARLGTIVMAGRSGRRCNSARSDEFKGEPRKYLKTGAEVARSFISLLLKNRRSNKSLSRRPCEPGFALPMKKLRVHASSGSFAIPPPPYNEAVNDPPPEYVLSNQGDNFSPHRAIQRSCRDVAVTLLPSLAMHCTDRSVDLKTPRNLKENKKNKKKAGNTRAFDNEGEKNDDTANGAQNAGGQGNDADGAGGDNGESGAGAGGGGDGSGGGGGGGDDGGDGGDDWGDDWNITTSKKKNKKKQQEEEEKKRKEEDEQKKEEEQKAAEAAAATKKNDLSWADEVEGNGDDAWAGFETVGSKKKNKKAKGIGAAAAVDDSATGFQDVKLDDHVPQLDLNFDTNVPKSSGMSFSFAGWGKSWSTGGSKWGFGALDTEDTNPADDNEKEIEDKNPWSTSKTLKKNKTKIATSNPFDFGDFGQPAGKSDGVVDNSTSWEDTNAAEEDSWGFTPVDKKNKKKTKAAEEPPAELDPIHKEKDEAVEAEQAAADDLWTSIPTKKDKKKKKSKEETEPEAVPGLVSMPAPESQAEDHDDKWDVWGISSKKASKNSSKSVEPAPKPVIEIPPAIPEPEPEDNWGITLSKKDKRKAKKGVSKAEEEVTAKLKTDNIVMSSSSSKDMKELEVISDNKDQSHGFSNDDLSKTLGTGFATYDDKGDDMVSTKKDKKSKSINAKLEPELEPEPQSQPEPEPEAKHEPPSEEQPAEPEPEIALDPLYDDWDTLSSKEKKKREKALNKKGLPIPGKNGFVLPKPHAVEPVVEAEKPDEHDQGEPAEPDPAPVADPEPEPSISNDPLYENWTTLSSRQRKQRERELKAKGLPIPGKDGFELPPPPPTKAEPTDAVADLLEPEDSNQPATEPVVEQPAEDNSWGVWGSAKDKKKSKKGKVEEAPLPPPPAPTPPALGLTPEPDSGTLDDPSLLDTVPAKNAKGSKKSATNEEETPAKSFWLSLGGGTSTKSKSTRSPGEKQSVEGLLIDIPDDKAFSASAAPAAAPIKTSDPSKTKAPGKISVAERIRALEQNKKDKKDRVKETATEIPEEKASSPPPSEPVQELPRDPTPQKKLPLSSSKSKTSKSSSSKKQAPPELIDFEPIEEKKTSRESVPGSFPDASDDVDPVLEAPSGPVSAKPEPETVKASKKKIKGSSTSKKAIAATRELPHVDVALSAEAAVDESEQLEKASGAFSKPLPESGTAAKPSKKDRPRIERTNGATSWGFWGPQPPVKKSSKNEPKAKENDDLVKKQDRSSPSLAKSKSTATKQSKEGGSEGEKSSTSEREKRREVRPPRPSLATGFSAFILGGQSPVRTKSTRVAKPSTSRPVSRRASVDIDDAKMPVSPNRKHGVSSKAAEIMGVSASKSKRERLAFRSRRSNVPDAYPLEDDDLADPDRGELDGRSPKESPKESDRRREKRKSKTQALNGDGAQEDGAMAESGEPAQAPEILSGPDDLGFAEAPSRERRLKRSSTLPRKAEGGGGFKSLFGPLRKATRQELPERHKSRSYRDDDQRHMTDGEHDEARRQRREEKSRRSVRPETDIEYAALSNGFFDAGIEDAEARRAARRAKRASRHVDAEYIRGNEPRDEEEQRLRRREREREKARAALEARDPRAREQGEADERRREERRARRVSRQERRPREEQDPRQAEADARADAEVRTGERRERRRARDEDKTAKSRLRSRSERRRSRAGAGMENGAYMGPEKNGGRSVRRSLAEDTPKSNRRESRQADESRAIPLMSGADNKTSSWVHSQADDPPEPPPIVPTVLDTPGADGAQAHSLSSDEEARREIRRRARRRAKYQSLADDEIDGLPSRRRETRRPGRENIKSNSGNGDYDRKSYDSRYAPVPLSSGLKRPSWLKKFTSF